MGYHVSIVRTGQNGNGIREDEIVAIGGKFSLAIERNESGVVKQVSGPFEGEEILLFYDDAELWTKNPTDMTLKVMIEIANELGKGARVRGDEGETYESVLETYKHPDDAYLAEESKTDFVSLLPTLIKIVVAGVLVYVGLKFLMKSFL